MNRTKVAGSLRHSSCVVCAMILATMLLASCISSSHDDDRRQALPGQGRTLRVAAFGGSSERQMAALAGDIFRHLTGAEIEWEQGKSRTHLNTLVAWSERGRGDPPFDVVLLDGIIQEMAATRGLLIKTTPADVPLMRDLLPQAHPQVDGGPAFQFFSVGILCHPYGLREAGIPEPTSWADFWRPELQGRLAVPSITHTAGMDFIVAATQVVGADPTTIEGMKAGIDAIAELEPTLVYTRMLPLQQGIETARILMVPLYNSRAFDFVDAGLPVRFLMPRERGFGHTTTINVVRGSPNEKLAHMFINTVLGRGYQYGQAVETPYGPVHQAVIGPLSIFPTVRQRVPLGPEGLSQLQVPHWERINAMRYELEEYWWKRFPRS